VDRAGEGFLARAGLADDEDRQAVARSLGGDGERGAEIGGGADQFLERERVAELFGQWRHFARGAATVGVDGERFEQALGRDRLDEVVGRAGAHCFDRQRTA
jgi:hypothetical protein